MPDKSGQKSHSYLQLAFGGGTPRKALGTSVIVGTILVTINHGDAILAGESVSLPKIILTYCVPYLVATWGAVTGKVSAMN